MSLAKLRARIADPAPGFECLGVDRTRFVVPIRSELGGPAPEKALAGLARFLDGACPTLLSLYREVSGIRLYIGDAGGDEVVGVEIPPLAGLADLQESFQDALALIDDAGDLDDAIVLCAVPKSGNYLVIPITGGRRGRVLFYDHEMQNAERFANDVNELLAILARDPVDALRKLRSTARYGAMQGVPQKYLANRAAK